MACSRPCRLWGSFVCGGIECARVGAGVSEVAWDADIVRFGSMAGAADCEGDPATGVVACVSSKVGLDEPQPKSDRARLC